MDTGLFHNNVFRIGCFVILLIVGGVQMKFYVQEQQVFSGNVAHLETGHLRDAKILTHLSQKQYMLEGDGRGAKLLLQQALIHSSYSIPAWLSLAELYNDEGQKRQSRKVLEYIDQLTSEVKRWRWEKTLVDYQIGRLEVLPSELSYIIAEMPGKSRRDALQLAFTLWEHPDELVTNVGYQNVEYLFKHAIAKKLPEKGLYLWNIIQNQEIVLQEKSILSFLNMLLQKKEIKAAGDIWRAYFNSETILFNQNFSKPLLKQGFGWRIGKDKAFVLRQERDIQDNKAGVLHYRFKGWDNLNFHHLYQIVPIDGGQMYEFTGEYKTKNLTTDQRPFIDVHGYNCKTPYIKSEMVEANEDWKNTKFVFGVSDECDAVVVRMRRVESRQIDNKLSGQLWLRNFQIEQTGEVYTAFDDYP